jgi:hypothetical protein
MAKKMEEELNHFIHIFSVVYHFLGGRTYFAIEPFKIISLGLVSQQPFIGLSQERRRQPNVADYPSGQTIDQWTD